MKIFVKDITSGGLEVHKKVDPESIGLAKEDLDWLSPLDVTASLERILNSVSAKVILKIKSLFTCDRCLESFERDLDYDFKFSYLIEPQTLEIEIGEDIRQEIILSLTGKFLCNEDCRGICPDCGVNLNLEKCLCKK